MKEKEKLFFLFKFDAAFVADVLAIAFFEALRVDVASVTVA